MWLIIYFVVWSLTSTVYYNNNILLGRGYASEAKLASLLLLIISVSFHHFFISTQSPALDHHIIQNLQRKKETFLHIMTSLTILLLEALPLQADLETESHPKPCRPSKRHAKKTL